MNPTRGLTVLAACITLTACGGGGQPAAGTASGRIFPSARAATRAVEQ